MAYIIAFVRPWGTLDTASSIERQKGKGVCVEHIRTYIVVKPDHDKVHMRTTRYIVSRPEDK